MSTSHNPGVMASALSAVSMPDRVDTVLGEFTFTDGVPDADTIEKSYRMLDLTRAIDVYLNTISGASLVAMRNGFRSIGVDRQTVLGYSDPLIDSQTLGEASWKKAFVGGNHEFLDNGRPARCPLRVPQHVSRRHPRDGHGDRRRRLAVLLHPEDSTGAWLDGARSFRLRLPADIPAKKFWSIDLCDNQTRSPLQTDHPYPSIVSLSGTVVSNDDGTTDIWFGPKRQKDLNPTGSRRCRGRAGSRTCASTVPRSRGPTSWHPGEIEPVETSAGSLMK